ncbi:MAG TPA: FtsQ-type POTRA domain-containing protein [Dehalococcoidia bacterium]|nr:FtsQ-type POTRA domain-containing protein [Dehalococcoidia bacterium]
MSTGLLEGSAQQQHAAVRAQAAAIADAPRPARRYSLPDAALRPSPRRRRNVRPRPVPEPTPKSVLRRRILAGGILLAQVALLVMALTLPAFQVKRVVVSGERVLTSQGIAQAAAIPRQSIFTVNPQAIRSRLLSVPWVEDASVTTALPATVRITVVERQPVVRVRRLGVDTFVAANGATLAATPALERLWASTPALLDERVGSAQPVDPRLLNVMAVLADRFPAVCGVKVAGLELGADNIFSVWTSAGWAAVFGHLDTAEAFAAVPAQLSALAALRGVLDFIEPGFGYINLENPATPAAGGARGLPAAIANLSSLPVPVQPAPPYVAPSGGPATAPSAGPSLAPVGSTASPSPTSPASPSPGTSPTPDTSPTPGH